MFAGIIFILSFFNYESPRYLMKVGKREQALTTLARLRNLPVDNEFVTDEIADIHRQLEEEQEATHGNGFFSHLREIFLVKSNLYRIYLGLFSQIMSQWSGAQSMTVSLVHYLCKFCKIVHI